MASMCTAAHMPLCDLSMRCKHQHTFITCTIVCGSVHRAVILPIYFVSSQDAAIGHAILQEFVEARRSPACGKAPSCNYHPGKVN